MQIHHKDKNANHNVSSNGCEYMSLLLMFSYVGILARATALNFEALVKRPKMVACICLPEFGPDRKERGHTTF